MDQDIPGPGQYVPPEAERGPAYSMRQRLTADGRDPKAKLPGPGAVEAISGCRRSGVVQGGCSQCPMSVVCSPYVSGVLHTSGKAYVTTSAGLLRCRVTRP